MNKQELFSMNVKQKLHMTILVTISIDFINAGIGTLRENQNTQESLDRCLNAFRGHVQTNDFLALEVARMARYVPFSSVDALLAMTFLRERSDVSVDVCSTTFLRDLWLFVLDNVHFNIDPRSTLCQSADVRAAVELFINVMVFRFRCADVSYGPAIINEPELKSSP